jgi:hypothetical protein
MQIARTRQQDFASKGHGVVKNTSWKFWKRQINLFSNFLPWKSFCLWIWRWFILFVQPFCENLAPKLVFALRPLQYTFWWDCNLKLFQSQLNLGLTFVTGYNLVTLLQQIKTYWFPSFQITLLVSKLKKKKFNLYFQNSLLAKPIFSSHSGIHLYALLLLRESPII